MPSSGLEDLDRAVQARRQARRRGARGTAADPAPPPSAPARGGVRDRDPADARARAGGATTVRPRATVRAGARPLPRIDPARMGVLGAPLALLPAAFLAIVGLLVWSAAPGGHAGAAQDAAAYLLALLALPTLLLTGLPFYGGSGRVLLAVVTSAVVWLVLGRWAARRARRETPPSWRGYAAELAPMVAGVWAGVIVGLVAMVMILSH